MCWIAKKIQGNPIPFEYMDTAQKKNKDGYGVSWYDKGKIHTFKTLDYSEFKSHLTTIEDHLMVIHLRNATVGTSTCTVNVHPFIVPTGVMFHNGTISSLRSTTSESSDTNLLAQAISSCKVNKVSDIAPLLQIIAGSTINKLVFLNKDGTVDIINRHLGIDDDNGNWYSNDYHLKEKSYYVFVYGTLKAGFSNHTFYMEDSTLVAPVTTVDKYAMIGKDRAFPYLLCKHEAGYNIKGELYEVPASSLSFLDRLEGVPTHYNKQLISVKTAGGKVYTAITYIKTSVTQHDLEKEFIDEFQKPIYKAWTSKYAHYSSDTYDY